MGFTPREVYTGLQPKCFFFIEIPHTPILCIIFLNRNPVMLMEGCVKCTCYICHEEINENTLQVTQTLIYAIGYHCGMVLPHAN